jgi:integrase
VFVKRNSSASAAINKWIKTIAGTEAVIYGFRHGFRDRLRAVEAPIDMIDQLGGWSLRGVGQGYGDGYQLNLLHRWMERIVI